MIEAIGESRERRVMEEYLLKIQPFDLDNIPSTELRQRWLEYKKQFTYISSAMSKKKRKKLKNIFLVVAGRQLQRVYENLPPRDNVENDEETDEFKILIDQLDGYFAPKQHDMLERYTFGSLVPDAGETLDKFLLRAQAEANKCQFGSTTAESREIAVIDKLFKINSVDESNVVAHQVPEVMAGSGSVGGEGAPFICAIGENHDELIWCRIGGITVEMMIDSGSKYNIIDEFTWKFLRNRNAEICALEPSSKCLTAYAQTVCLNVVGSFEANISVVSDKKKACLRTAFYVIKDGKQNLLGRDSAKQLGVLRIGLPNTWESNSINNIPEDVQHFPVIKGVKLRIEIDISVTPVAQHVRRVPIALRQKVEDQIQKLLHSGIIERVEEHSPWVSPMVVVMKDNGEVRLCIDMRRANTAIKREYHMIPTLDDLLSRSVHYKIPSLRDIETTPPIDPEACDRDLVNKYHGKEREDNRRHAKPCGIVEGDRVIVQNLISGNKLQPTFAPTRYEVIRRKGNQVEIKDQNGNTFVRNTAHLKKVSAGDDGSGIQVEPVVSQGDGSSIQVEPVVLQDQQMPSDQQRPSRSANPPYWHQDFVFD
ncbi:uncharacterized protein LOC129743194 [Uranotaenia lowii]|uniref:uncharacterized protein LOC129743194 n=1 Tax=Uranotaenia lowii TaxID=190385 RepID=UPI0024787A78|nr:uncharacterized protein LOC129743194 [Uranotaenia lowii]